MRLERDQVSHILATSLGSVLFLGVNTHAQSSFDCAASLCGRGPWLQGRWRAPEPPNLRRVRHLSEGLGCPRRRKPCPQTGNRRERRRYPRRVLLPLLLHRRIPGGPRRVLFHRHIPGYATGGGGAGGGTACRGARSGEKEGRSRWSAAGELTAPRRHERGQTGEGHRTAQERPRRWSGRTGACFDSFSF